jgi:hypothetical protein
VGGEGFAGAGRALEDEDGEGPIGAKGGEEPGETAEPIGAPGEMRQERRAWRGAEGGPPGAGTGSGREVEEREVWRSALAPAVVLQESGEISTKRRSESSRSRRICL